MQESKVMFGSFNVETGESFDGYIDKNGEMKYKKRPWYKRIFGKRYEEPKKEIITKTEYIGTTQLYSQLIWSKNKNYFTVAVYRKYIPENNVTISLFSKLSDRTVYYNVDAYDKDKYLIYEE